MASVLSVGSPLMMTRFVRGTSAGGERLVGGVRAVVRHLLADDEEQRDRRVLFAQSLGGADHRGGDPLGVARAPSVDVAAVARAAE